MKQLRIKLTAHFCLLATLGIRGIITALWLLTYREGESTTFKENSVVCQGQCCTKLQLDLSEAASELKSAKEIVTIQLVELNSQTIGTYFLRCT